MSKEATQILLLVLVELVLAVAVWQTAREKRLRTEGTPSVHPPLHHAWFLSVVLPGAVAAYHFIQQSDWLSLGMQGLGLLSAALVLHLHARRVVVGCVPAADVTQWVRAWASSRGVGDDAWKVQDRWDENRSVVIELSSGGRSALVELAEALRPRVQAFPSPGPWNDVGLPVRIATPFLLACMVLIPFAIWVSRISWRTPQPRVPERSPDRMLDVADSILSFCYTVRPCTKQLPQQSQLASLWRRWPAVWTAARATSAISPTVPHEQQRTRRRKRPRAVRGGPSPTPLRTW